MTNTPDAKDGEKDGKKDGSSSERGVEVPLMTRLMNRLKSPRRMVNILLLPRLQLGMSAAILAITVTFLLCIAAMFYIGLEPLSEAIMQSTDADSEMRGLVMDQLWHAAAQCGILIMLYAGFLIALTLVITHRMIGPTVAFKRHVDNLLKGDFDSRVRLRTSDAFQDLASRLNELAIQMNDRKR